MKATYMRASAACRILRDAFPSCEYIYANNLAYLRRKGRLDGYWILDPRIKEPVYLYNVDKIIKAINDGTLSFAPLKEQPLTVKEDEQ